MPIPLFHGTEDGTVPFELSEEFHELRPDLVRFESFVDAGHVRSWNVDPERHDAVLRAFLDGL